MKDLTIKNAFSDWYKYDGFEADDDSLITNSDIRNIQYTAWIACEELKDLEYQALKSRLDECEKALNELTMPFTEYLTMDDLAEHNKEIREKFKLDNITNGINSELIK